MSTTVMEHLDPELVEHLMSLNDPELDDILLGEHDEEVETNLTAFSQTYVPPSYEHVLEDDDENVVDLEVVAIEVNQHMAELKAAGMDLEGEALMPLPCSFCQDTVMVDPTPLPEGHEDYGKPRVPACKECGKAEAREAAAQGKTVTVVRTPRIKKHQPRLVCTPEELASADSKRSEEEPMIDLSKYSDEQLGAMVREHLLSRLTAEVPVSRAAAEIEKAATTIIEQEAMEADRAARKALEPLAAFKVGNVKIPVLDLREVTSLDTLATAKERSPYNKALHHLGRDLLDAETATYAVLAEAHRSLMETVASKPRGARKTVTAAVIATPDVDDTTTRKIEALVEIGYDREAAVAHVANL